MNNGEGSPIYMREIGMEKDANFPDSLNKTVFEHVYLKTVYSEPF